VLVDAHELERSPLQCVEPTPSSNCSSRSSSPNQAPPLEPPLTDYQLPVAIKKSLYVSHALSTWNSRVFEFGAVLYLASIFPNTLMPMSIYALVRSLSAVVLSPFVGGYIDTKNRLHVLRVSISKSSWSSRTSTS
jgi:iron-regulated transporter 1